MRSFALVSMALLGAVALAGCAEDTKNDIREAIEEPALQKTWAQEACRPNAGLGSIAGTMRATYVFKGSEVSVTEDYFSDAGCSVPAASVQYIGAFTIGAEVSPGVQAIDLRYQTVVAAPRTEAVRDTLNTVSLCGKSDWAVNVSADMTGASTLALCPLRDTPSVMFDIFWISNGRLYFGKGDKNDPAARPAELDLEEPFVQQ